MKRVLFLLFFTPLFSNVNIIFPDTTVSSGDTLIYPVLIQHVQPEDSIYGGQFWISLSSPILNPVRVFQGDITGDWGVAFDTTGLSLTIVMWGGTALQIDGVLFNIKFAVGPTDTAITAQIIVDSCYLIDELANSVPLTVDTGSILIIPTSVSENSTESAKVDMVNNMGRNIRFNIMGIDGLRLRVYSFDGRLMKDVSSLPGVYILKGLKSGVYFLTFDRHGEILIRRKVVIWR